MLKKGSFVNVTFTATHISKTIEILTITPYMKRQITCTGNNSYKKTIKGNHS